MRGFGLNTTWSYTHTHTYLILLNVEPPDNEVPVGSLRLHGHCDFAILHHLPFFAWPVRVAHLLSSLVHVAQHHDTLALELPDHAPKVIHCGLQRGLCSYVGIATLVALERGMEGGREGEERNLSLRFKCASSDVYSCTGIMHTSYKYIEGWGRPGKRLQCYVWTHINEAGVDVVRAILPRWPETSTRHVIW